MIVKCLLSENHYRKKGHLQKRKVRLGKVCALLVG